MSSGPALDGDLHVLPFLSGGLGETVAPLFADLADEHGVDNVLVLKRFPTGTDAIAETLGEASDTVERPEVIGLSAHASRCLEELDDPPRRLDGAERNLLLQSFVEEREWDTDYLRRAAEKESFPFDVGRFVTEATWQGSTVETDDQTLSALAATNEAYHEWLETADAIDPARGFRFATDRLADDDVRARVQEPFDAVLALEFEEFTPVDREYLARLTEDCRLVCVAEAESAIQRTWNEPGQITDHVSGLGTEHEGDEPPRTIPDAIASFLATGDVPERPDEGRATVIERTTFRDQVATVAEEIARLHRTEGVPYDEMAVVLRDSNAPIPETLRRLRTAGVPVSSATVSGLEHDPVARELYALASWCSRNEGTERAEDEPGRDVERARSVLDARVDGLTEAMLERIRERGREEELVDALDRWLLETDLKDRVATGEETLAVKTQFDHVATIRSLAAAISGSPLVEGDWQTFCEGLEHELQRATTDKIATELDLPEGGVLVDAVRVVKNTEREAVFLLDVVDREYPAEPSFNPLFPTPHLEQLPAYPAFSTPDEADVRETFAFADGDVTRPLHAYYAALSRRLLAVGARAATERVYFGVYREEAGSEQQLQPSRFLDAIEAAFGELERLDHDEIHTHGEAVRFALDGVDDAFEEIQRAGLVREPVDIEDVETEFASIQQLLESDPPDDLADAIEARVDFAEGAVRRE